AISNRVCFCVPRYLLLRTEFTAASNVARTAPGKTLLALVPGRTQLIVGPLERDQEVVLGGVFNKIRASAVFNRQQTSVVRRIDGLEIREQVQFTGKVTGSCLPPELELAGKPLVIIKWPDKCD